ncbi:MAG: flagellar biosynthesis protein FliQ [Candidatus Melainabacteria bacterium]|nr:flagellar biosynthesis protein FliQ [Candidatus Melainabacteria bacterium]
MTERLFIDLLNETLWVMLLLSAPVLVVTMVVGVLISIGQAITQIQEQTLTFVPKILAALATLAFIGPWMTDLMVNHTNKLMVLLIRVAQQ